MQWYHRLRAMPVGRRMRRSAFFVLGGLLVWFFLHAAVVLAVGTSDRVGAADVAVVFGNAVTAEGAPRPELRRRLDRVLEVYQQGLVSTIVVSGSTAAGRYNEPRVMRQYLVQRGIDGRNILDDESGFNTMHTAANAARLMHRRGWQTVLVVSDGSHLPRVRLALARAGVRSVRWGHARLGWRNLSLFGLVREFLGFYWYFLCPVPDGIAPSAGPRR